MHRSDLPITNVQDLKDKVEISEEGTAVQVNWSHLEERPWHCHQKRERQPDAADVYGIGLVNLCEGRMSGV